MADSDALRERFVIQEQIGAGGMGTVYKGYDRQTSQTVAIKELRADLLARDRSVLERFEREATALARLNHPHIVKVLATYSTGGRYCLVMEYVDGGSLADLIDRQGRLTLDQACQIALDLSDALIRAHRLKIIHRDIKPANVLLGSDGTSRLADFNIAYISDLSTITQDRARIGTYAYMSPETYEGQPPTERTDIWSFGVTLFEMITGRRPFIAYDLHQLEHVIRTAPLPNLQTLCPEAPPELAALMASMLERNPEKRIRSMRVVGSRLEELLRTLHNAGGRAAETQSGVLETDAPTVTAPETSESSTMAVGAAETSQPDGPPASVVNQIRLGEFAQASVEASARVGMQSMAADHQRALTLDIEITADGDSLLVTARSEGESEHFGPSRIDLGFETNLLPSSADDITQWVDLFCELNRIRAPSGDRRARELGARLFRQIFGTPELERLYRACYKRVRDRAASFLRLRLHIPPQLTALPWELLFDPAEQLYLARSPDIALTRTPVLQLRGTLQPLGKAVRIVAVLARPYEAPPIDFEAQLRPLHAAIHELRASGHNVMFDLVEGPGTWKQLEDALSSKGPVHMLQIICHGGFDEEGQGEGVLLFENALGHKQKVYASNLRDLLNLHRHDHHAALRLVFVTACKSGTSARGNAFSSIGETLSRGGTPAVVAMQFMIAQHVAQDMVTFFYRRLITGNPIDLALGKARLIVGGEYADDLYWAVPVLFLHPGGETIFGHAENKPLPDLTVDAPDPQPHPPRPRPDLIPPKRDERRQIKPSDPALVEAEIAFVTKNWREAARRYEELNAAYRLPASHLTRLNRAIQEVRRLDEIDQAQSYLQQERWSDAIALLEDMQSRLPGDEQVRTMMERAREERSLVELVLQIVALEQDQQWQEVLERLDRLEQRRPAYANPRFDLKSLRRQALVELTSEQARRLAEAEEWNEALITLERIPADFMAEPLRGLKKFLLAKIQEQDNASRRKIFAQIEDLIRTRDYAAALDEIERLAAEPEGRAEASALLARLIEEPAVALDGRLRAGRLAHQIGDGRQGVSGFPMAMVTITGGSLVMGSTPEEIREAGQRHLREQAKLVHAQHPRDWSNDELNGSSVRVDGFMISRYLVTNEQFGHFVLEDGYHPEKPWWPAAFRGRLIEEGLDRPAYWLDQRLGHIRRNHPVVGVSWFEAQAFCQWLTLHATYNPEQYVYRLPSEAEWEWAARGTRRRPFPWGDQPPDREHANHHSFHHGTTPVGCFVKGYTPETNLADMAGNVWEWTGSFYEPYPFQTTNLHTTLPQATAVAITIRGGGWSSQPTLLRAAHRYALQPNEMKRFLGFRVVRELRARKRPA